MLVHVFDDTPHHYNPMRCFFTEQCDIDIEQHFWVRKPCKATAKNTVFNKQVRVYADNGELISKLKSLPQSAQVVFHGLFDVHIWRKLILLSMVKRCSCVIWGAELYRHGKPARSLKQYIAQLIHMGLVKRFRSVVALNPGDASLAGKYLKRKKVQVLPYPLIGYNPEENSQTARNENAPIRIMLGNSAASSNEHEFALERIAHFAPENVEILVPLNYAGKEEYIRKIISKGKSLFGDKFKAITNMLSKDEYDTLLAGVDVTIFAHQRQQGLYVAYAMLLMGKPMFLMASTSSFSNLSDLGFNVYSTESLCDIPFTEMCAMVLEKDENNTRLMSSNFTEQALAPKWSALLNGLFAR